MSDLRSRIVDASRRLPTMGDANDPETFRAVLSLLHEIGRRDLPLGRLFEGHVDALQIILRYGRPEQAAAARSAAERGAAFGVWNADLSSDRLVLDGDRLSGGKAFASGAGILSHALVTVDGVEGRQLILVDLARHPPAIDRSVWRVVGMQRSETHVVRWQDVAMTYDDTIGSPGDYVREPWFSGGALRFTAVQAGGIAALVDHARDHLVALDRAGGPHQTGRLAALYQLASGAAGAIRLAADAWFSDAEARLPLVAAARAAVYEAGSRAIMMTQDAVGVAGAFVDHPLATTVADLSVYLRQPGPDAQRMAVGRAVADGTLRVGL